MIYLRWFHFCNSSLYACYCNEFLSHFFPYLNFFCCLRKTVLRDCVHSWVTSFLGFEKDVQQRRHISTCLSMQYVQSVRCSHRKTNKNQRACNVASTSLKRHDVASTLMRRCINVMYRLGTENAVSLDHTAWLRRLI